MRKIYKTYFAPTYTESIENFYNTSTYITRVSHDYAGKEEKFTGIEAFGVGQSFEVENGLGKYIKSKYMGVIENMGIIEAHYDDKKDEFQIGSLNEIIGEDHFNNPVLHKKIKDCLRNQHEAFHYENKMLWTKKIKWLFIQVKKVNVFENNVLYKQKEIQDIYTEFDKSGSLILSEKKHRYFKMYRDVYYDFEKKYFIQGDKTILIVGETTQEKKIFFEFLMGHANEVISKEVLMTALGYDVSLKKSNIILLELKRKIVDTELTKLYGTKDEGIDKKTSKEYLENELQNVFIAEQYAGYKIIGEFVDSIPT